MPIKPPKEIAKTMAECSVTKAGMSFDRLLILGMFAGVYIGFGAVLMTTVKNGTSAITDATGTHYILGPGMASLIGGAVFSVGLMLVVIGGAELFTGNCLVPVGVLEGMVSLPGLAKNWLFVYIGNVLGALLLVALMFGSGLYGSEGDAMFTLGVGIASAKAELGIVEMFCRAILCNWLVCLAVWLALSADSTTGKIFSCFFPIMAFVASGFEHSIANWFFIPMGFALDASAVDIVGMFLNLAVVTVGNVIGGAFFVGFLYWYVYLKGAESA